MGLGEDQDLRGMVEGPVPVPTLHVLEAQAPSPALHLMTHVFIYQLQLGELGLWLLSKTTHYLMATLLNHRDFGPVSGHRTISTIPITIKLFIGKIWYLLKLPKQTFH